MKNLQIFVDGKELETIGEPRLTIPPDPGASLEHFKWDPDPDRFKFSAKLEIAIPRDLQKLRSVSPAAKRAFARQRWAKTFDAWFARIR